MNIIICCAWGVIYEQHSAACNATMLKQQVALFCLELSHNSNSAA